MKAELDFGYIFVAAVGVVGSMEYIKTSLPKVPGWVWRIALPLVCIGVAAAANGGIFQIASNAILLLAVSHLGYDQIIARLKAKLDVK